MTTPEPEIVEPRAAALVESLRSFGYSPETSVADLVDNSLSAGAARISVTFRWDGPRSWMAIVDDGRGMSENELREAMRAGSRNPLEDRGQKDLGRFGLGLKTASFAQARVLAVRSKSAQGNLAERSWDLDHIQETDRWELLPGVPDDTPELVGTGTVVAWHRMDRIVDDRPTSDPRAEESFNSTVHGVKEHLEMVFHRFIESGITIAVNGVECRAWDPFLANHPDTEELHAEVLPISLADGGVAEVRIQPYVLPHSSALLPEEHSRAAGPRGWNQQQGYYLYRANRLIVAGDWFDPGIKPEEHHKLARICVEMDQAMDEGWALDVKKSRARPPGSLRHDFKRVARATRSRAEAVYRTRGARAVGSTRKSSPTVPIWELKRAAGVLEFNVNTNHDGIREVLERLKQGDRGAVERMLRLVARHVPVATILSEGYRNEEKLRPPDLTSEETALAERILRQLFMTNGENLPAALQALGRIQPYDQHPEVVGVVAEKLEQEWKSE